MITRRTLLATSAAFALTLSIAAPALADPDTALAKLQETVLSKGPNGEDPAAASSVTLTDEELAKIKGMNATAAIVMHYGGNDWSQAQINGLQTQFAAMGIKVIAVTDAGFKPEKQVADLETIMAQKPSIIVSIPTDPVATAERLQGGCGCRCEAGVHGQRPCRLHRGQGLRLCRFRRTITAMASPLPI
jgi:ribose transport system substrate-binding protein